MKTNILADAINLVDDDLLCDAMNIPAKRVSIKKYIAVAAAFAFTLIAVFAGAKYLRTDDNIIFLTNPLYSKPQISMNEEINAQTTQSETTQAFSTKEDRDALSESVSTGDVDEMTTSEADGGLVGIGGFNETISNGELQTEGTAFTQAEIDKIIEDNKYAIVGAVAAEYGDFDSVYRINRTGYGHVILGETNLLRYGYIDLPVTRNGQIISIVTLFRTENGTSYSIGARGIGIDNLNDFIHETPDKELAFFYYGLREIVALPNNELYNPITDEKETDFDKSIDYYGKYKTEYNTFSLKELNDLNNSVEVKPQYEIDLSGKANNKSDHSVSPNETTTKKKDTENN